MWAGTETFEKNTLPLMFHMILSAGIFQCNGLMFVCCLFVGWLVLAKVVNENMSLLSLLHKPNKK